MKMDPTVKGKWIGRLISDEYQQGKRYLNRDNKLCCLGVLCEIAAEEGVITKTVEYESNGTELVRYGTGQPGIGELAILPVAVAEWAGLKEQNAFGPGTEPTVNPVLLGAYKRASDLNDSLGFTFKQIALVIDSVL